MTLAELKKGEKAIIVKNDETELPLKIVEMGCMEGAMVEVIQKNFLSDPIYIKANDSFLIIRKDLASIIYVEKE